MKQEQYDYGLLIIKLCINQQNTQLPTMKKTLNFSISIGKQIKYMSINCDHFQDCKEKFVFLRGNETTSRVAANCDGDMEQEQEIKFPLLPYLQQTKGPKKKQKQKLQLVLFWFIIKLEFSILIKTSFYSFQFYSIPVSPTLLPKNEVQQNYAFIQNCNYVNVGSYNQIVSNTTKAIQKKQVGKNKNRKKKISTQSNQCE